MLQEPTPISIPAKITAAAVGILCTTALLMVIFGNREWKGLETLVTASMLVPLTTVCWPLIESGGNRVLFGIDAARQAIYRRRKKDYDAGVQAGIERGRQEGYRLGYDARASEERSWEDENGNEPRWLYGGPNEDR